MLETRELCTRDNVVLTFPSELRPSASAALDALLADEIVTAPTGAKEAFFRLSGVGRAVSVLHDAA